jgi:hypothetical protein
MASKKQNVRLVYSSGGSEVVSKDYVIALLNSTLYDVNRAMAAKKPVWWIVPGKDDVLIERIKTQVNPVRYVERRVNVGADRWEFSVYFEGALLAKVTGLDAMAKMLRLSASSLHAYLRRSDYVIERPWPHKNRLVDATIRRDPLPTRTVKLGGKRGRKPYYDEDNL